MNELFNNTHKSGYQNLTAPFLLSKSAGQSLGMPLLPKPRYALTAGTVGKTGEKDNMATGGDNETTLS